LDKPISNWRLVLFAAPAFLTWVMHGPGGGVLTGLYAKYFGVSLAALGGALLIGRVFDAVTDPLIGWLSDRTNTRIGSRKPFIIVGYTIALVAFYFLFNPPENPGVTYFLICYMSLIFGWTVADIPHQAWMADLSHDYDDRTRIVTFRSLAERAGSWGFWFLPLLPIFASNEMTPEVVQFLGWLLFLLIPLFVAAAVIWVPQGKILATKKSEPIWGFIKELPSNKPMMLFIATMLVSGIADGFFSAGLFLFFDAYLQQGDKLSYAMLINGGIVLVAMPLWYQVAKKIGKHYLWMIAMSGSGIVMIGVFFANPGESGYLIGLAVTTLVMAIYSAGNIAQPAILTDIIDYDTLKYGANRSGQFFAIQLLVFKFNYAIAGSLALFTLSYFDFDATAAVQTISGVIGIKLVVGGIPMVCMALASAILLFFPLNKHRCHVITRRLEQRVARANREIEQEPELVE